MWTRTLISFGLGAALSTTATAALAHETCAAATRDSVVACALRASPRVRAEREELEAAAGRRTAAAPWFPQNPALSFSIARRAGTEGRSATTNYYAAFSQEIEVAGQRAARRRAAEADVAGRTQDVVAETRSVAARAYAAYFASLAAHDALAVAERLDKTGAQIAAVVRARADAGVASPLDADVAEAASLRIAQQKLAAEREANVADATLATLFGRDPTAGGVAASGALEPLAGSDALAASSSRVVRERPEVRALLADERAFAARADAFRRARFPTFTLQVYAQNDGYDEKVLGAGVVIPLALPQPLGRFYTGEIAEAEALSQRSAALADNATRELSRDLATSIAIYQSRRAEADLYTRARVTRAEQVLADIAKELEAGRLAARDALLAQQQLIDVLRGHIETRRELCLASVALALAANVPLEGAPR